VAVLPYLCASSTRASFHLVLSQRLKLLTSDLLYSIPVPGIERRHRPRADKVLTGLQSLACSASRLVQARTMDEAGSGQIPAQHTLTLDALFCVGPRSPLISRPCDTVGYVKKVYMHTYIHLPPENIASTMVTHSQCTMHVKPLSLVYRDRLN
jgi:hypothetical protein